jgi:hypothetical protein
MPKFVVAALGTISLHTHVEAPTKAKAIELAEDRPLQGLEGNDGKPDEEWCHSGEIDCGEPFNLRVEKN